MPTLEEISTFSKNVLNFSFEHKLLLMDAIVSYCEKNQLEVEVAATLLSQKLKQRLYAEAQELNLVPRGSKLPF